MTRCLLALMAFLALGAAPAFAAEFDHAAHLTYLKDAECTACHLEEAGAILPADEVCLGCHDRALVDAVEFTGLKTHGPLWSLNHRPFAKGNTYDCAACHEQDYCLECHTDAGRADEMGSFGNQMVNVHRSDFHVSHPIAARTDPQLCSSCHENRFCVECHEDFAPADLALASHRRGFTDGTLGGAHAIYLDNPLSCQGCHDDPETGELSVIPSSTGWSAAHGREARKNLAACQACHPEGDICLRCHSGKTGLGVNPHPKDWDDIKGRLKRASDGKTCRKCH